MKDCILLMWWTKPIRPMVELLSDRKGNISKLTLAQIRDFRKMGYGVVVL